MIHKKIINLKKKLSSIFNSPKEVIAFFLPIILAIICLIPVPYYITLGGGTLSLDKKIEVSGEDKKKGKFYASYVKEMKGNVLAYGLSFVIPGLEREKIDDVVMEDEELDEYRFRERFDFDLSLENAKKVAFDSLGLPITEKESDLFVLYIDKESKTDLKVKDKILEVDGKKVKSREDVLNIINGKNLYDDVNILVLRDEEEVVTTTKVISINNEKKIGVYIGVLKKYETERDVSFDFSKREAGPSGGLMISLSLYNKLSSSDITKGRKVVGTGTIDEDGNVGEIGGVKYKLRGAARKGASIFFVPYENYKEAKDEKEDKGFDIELVPVRTFDEALEYLKTN